MEFKSTGMYSPKDLTLGDEGRARLMNGIRKMASAVKSTLGPSGKTVLIEGADVIGGLTVTKDGVTVANSIQLLDPIENLAVRMLREASSKTASSAGDGTTTAVVLAEALVAYGMEILEAHPAVNRTEVLRKLVEISNDVVEDLRRMARKLRKRELLDVAIISANNDKVIGKTIADVYGKVGADGIVMVENSQTPDTYYEVTNGLRIDKGYLSPVFVTDMKRDECVMNDVYVLVADMEIENVLQIERVLKHVIEANKSLLIIGPCGQMMLNTLGANKVKGRIKVCAIDAPSFGYRQNELMQDIALSVGAKYFSYRTGDDLSIIGPEDLGYVSKVTVGNDKTVMVVSNDHRDGEAVAERIEQLRGAHTEAVKKGDKDFIMSRIAMLSGSIGVIYVGGNTDLEQKELYDRIDDAVCAVRSALEEGIVAGGGSALYYEARRLERKLAAETSPTSAYTIATKIIIHALRAPFLTLVDNAGYEPSTPDERVGEWGYGWNMRDGSFGNLYDMGVIDPLKVTRSALQNAVSVAVTVLSTDAIITLARTYES